MQTPILVAVHVGSPRTFDDDRPWTTSLYKRAVTDRVWVHREHLDGDGQADRRVHGGADKAVSVYAVEHFAAWQGELGVADIGPGAFGENFSVVGQNESTVCIGDGYRVGSATVQVSQPRGPCWKVGRRWGRPDLAHRIRETGRTGWYLRVVLPGLVMAGDRVELIARPFPMWTIQRVNELSYREEANTEQRHALTECPLLAPSWRDSLS